MHKTKGIKFKARILFDSIIFLLSLNLTIVFLFAAEDTKAKKILNLNITRPTTEYKAEALRDPFVGRIIDKPVVVEKKSVKKEIKKSAPPSKPPQLQIQGIVWGGKAPSAIVNNKVVRVNESIDDIKILEINRGGIVVLYQGVEYNFTSPAADKVQNFSQQSKEDRSFKRKSRD